MAAPPVDQACRLTDTSACVEHDGVTLTTDILTVCMVEHLEAAFMRDRPEIAETVEVQVRRGSLSDVAQQQAMASLPAAPSAQ